MLIPIIILDALVLGIVVCTIAGAKNKSNGAKASFWLLTFLLSLPPLLVALLIVNLGSSKPLQESCVCLIVYLLTEALLGLIIYHRLRHRAFMIPFLCVLLCFGAACGWFYGSWAYEKSLATVAEPRDLLWKYDPANVDNRLARLDKPVELALTEDLPRLDGATALYPVYAAFANAVYPVEVLVPAEEGDPWNLDTDSEYLACTTTTEAYKRLVDGETDVIFVAGPSAAQEQYAEEHGEEMVFTPIGRECFVFFVHKNNPVNSLTVDELRGIYSGKITRWNQLGADLGKIRAFQRDEGSGSQSTLIRFMGETPLMKPRTENVVAGMGGIIERTADYRNYPNAIGYSFRFYATEMVQNGEIKLLEVSGIAPTKENILNGSYPLSSEFYAVTLTSNDNPNVPVLIDWILSREGQTLIDRTGYVALD